MLFGLQGQGQSASDTDAFARSLDMRLGLSLSIALVAPLPSLAAPVPMPKPGEAAEAVLEARTAERAAGAACYLRSDELIFRLFPSGERSTSREVVAEMNRRREGFTARVTITVEGSAVSLRVEGRDAMPLLRELVARLAGLPYLDEGWEGEAVRRVHRNVGGKAGRERAATLRDEWARRVALPERLKKTGKWCGPYDSYWEAKWQKWGHEFEADPLAIRKAPARVRAR